MTNLVKITLKVNIAKNVPKASLDLRLMEAHVKHANVMAKPKSVTTKLEGAIAQPRELLVKSAKSATLSTTTLVTQSMDLAIVSIIFYLSIILELITLFSFYYR